LDRSQGGLGIGLTMVRSLVEMHGGSVIGRSDGPGQGSEFIVRLPVLPQTQRFDQPSKAPKQRGNAPSRRVLVVDDSISTAETMAALLRMKGHDLRVANDGPKAVEIAAGFQPEVVLLDIGMPGMNGYQVARKLRRMPGMEQSLLIALSGYGQEEDLRCSHEAGFDHHLVKPAPLGVVEELVGSAAVPKSPKSVCAEGQPCGVLEGREPSLR
jgi:CheY-like chemotaxis protein